MFQRGEMGIVVINNGSVAKTVSLPAGSYVDLLEMEGTQLFAGKKMR